MDKTLQHERGQALILFAIAFVGLIGFAALAIDGGMLYSDRRTAQNSADAASLAGAGAAGNYLKETNIIWANWSCADPTVQQAKNLANDAAKLNAEGNGYLVDISAATNSVETECNDGPDLKDKYLLVKVYITTTTPSAFAHFIYGGPLESSVVAETKVKPPEPFAGGMAIVSLTHDCQGFLKGITFSGDISVDVEGGIYSNSCLDFNGGASCDPDNPSDCGVTADYIGYYDTGGLHKDPPNMYVDPFPVEDKNRVEPTYTFTGCDEYDNSDLNKFKDYLKSLPKDAPVVVTPGYWDSINVSTGDITFAPGLYCIEESITFNGEDLTAEGVTLAFVGDNLNKVELSITGNGKVTLTAPPPKCEDITGSGPNGEDTTPTWQDVCTTTDPVPPVGGLLVYMPEGNNKDVKLTGGAGSEFAGTVYAPESVIMIGGNADGETIHYGTQLIGETVKIGGTSDLVIKNQDELGLQIPTSLDFHR